MIIRKAGGLAALCATAAVLASPALAAERDGMKTYSVRVNRAAVTPSSAAQARRSLARLSLAASEVCGASDFSVPEYRYVVRHSPCWQSSMSDVVGRIDNPYLTAAFTHGGTVQVAQSQGGGTIELR